MHLPLLPVHRDSALGLFGQRAAWRAQPDVPADALMRLEHRLRLHLFVLAHAEGEPPDAETPPPADTALALLQLAPALMAGDAARRAAGARMARRWLDAEGPAVEAALLALALFPCAEGDEALGGFAEADTAGQVRRLQAWRIRGRMPEFLPPAEALEAGPLAALLALWAETPARETGEFRAWYDSADPAVREQALRGGLMRGDDRARHALDDALRGPDPATPGLLRLAALAGLATAHEPLRELAERDPGQGWPLIALCGGPEAAETLLEALGQARHGPAAARGWFLLTGQRLPQVPRLQVVGGEAAAGSDDRMADAEAARAWWHARASRLRETPRLLLGRPLDTGAVHHWLAVDAGAGAADALDLLALLQGGPPGVAAEDWLRHREAALARRPDVGEAAGA